MQVYFEKVTNENSRDSQHLKKKWEWYQTQASTQQIVP